MRRQLQINLLLLAGKIHKKKVEYMWDNLS